MTHWTSFRRAPYSHTWVVLLTLVACTEPVQRAVPLSVSIDADSIVRMNTVRIEVTVEAQNQKDKSRENKTWITFPQRSFTPDPQNDEDWPWKFTLEREQSGYDRYNLRATARDAQGSVVGRTQAIRELARVRHSGLRVRFDAACFRRTPLCDDGFTCSGGVCVDAADAPASIAADGGTSPTEMDGSTGDDPNAPDGVAVTGSRCVDNTRACAGHGSRVPLACENGTWRAQSDCLETESCNTKQGQDRGLCQPIADECTNREPTVPYCDGETMRVCTDLIVSDRRPCSENERCMPDPSTAIGRCVCRTGFVPEAGRCIEANKCGPASGGCDPLTQCSMHNGQRVCSGCPIGYSGTGEDGCAPLMQSLTLSEGRLDPQLTASERNYSARLPLLAHRVVFTPVAPAQTTVTLNGASLEKNGTWTSPVLPLDETKVELVLASVAGVSTKYEIELEREGEQQKYIKAVNPGLYDQFGSSLAISANTLLVTAWFEDSAATGVNGDPTNTSATDSGAAYVWVRDGDGWKQQAYLKPNDTATYDYFGTRAALEGDTIVVGAIHQGLFETTIGPPRQGAAYVYTRAAGVWSQTQRLAGSVQSGADLYGAGVALDRDTLVIGAPWESTGENRSGAVYIYQRSGSMFTEVQKLRPSKPSPDGRYGWSVALDGDRLVVGAPEGPPPHDRKGSAEIFARSGGTWMLSQYLQPMTLGGAANFGFSVSVRGERVAIAAPRTSPFPGSPAPTEPGEVYVFEAAGETWRQTAQLHAPIPRNTDWFGLSVLLTDGALVVGAPGDTSSERGIGADPMSSDAAFSGATYLFAPTASGWVQSTFIKGDNTDIDDWFGYALGSDGRTLAISALFENGSERTAGGSVSSGAVYVFR